MAELAKEIIRVNIEDEMRQSYLDYAMHMQVRTGGFAGIAEPADHLAAMHGLARLHRDAAGLEVFVEHVAAAA